MYISSGLLLLPLAPLVAASLYSKSSPVLQLDARSYERLVAKSNHTSIVEFYAPWCGHCKNLQPAYEKAASSLAGHAQVAAVNCDEESNKPFCGGMGIKGFPTLKIVKPAKKAGGHPVVEDYQGPRTAKGIVEAVRDKMPMHVKRLKDAALSEWLASTPSKPKALVFSDKGTVSPLVKALAIDFLDAMDFAFVRNTEKAAVERFGVKSFPTVILVPSNEGTPVTFDGELNKASLVEFLSQAATPNPVPQLVEAKKAKDSKKKEPKKSSVKSASKKPSQASMTLEPESDPTESPSPNVAQDQPASIQLPTKIPERIMALDSADALQKSCLHTKATTCILAILPDLGEAAESSAVSLAVSSLSEIAHKHAQRGAKMFPFYTIPSGNTGGKTLLDTLNVASSADQVQVIAVNAKRSWWKQYDGSDLGTAAIERWIDAIRYDEIKKEKLPEGIVKELQEEIGAETPTPDDKPMKMDGEANHDEL